MLQFFKKINVLISYFNQRCQKEHAANLLKNEKLKIRILVEYIKKRSRIIQSRMFCAQKYFFHASLRSTVRWRF